MTNATIAINQMVTRQTSDSKYSHFEGAWAELVTLVEENFASAKAGYRDGVKLVPVQPERFFSGVVRLEEGCELKSEFAPRRKGEEPYIQTTVVGGQKLPAKVVDIVIYDHATLGHEASTEADWEIISINARATEAPEPMTPVAMARNLLAMAGGTKAEYSAEEFAKAIIYWSQHAMRG